MSPACWGIVRDAGEQARHVHFISFVKTAVSTAGGHGIIRQIGDGRLLQLNRIEESDDNSRRLLRGIDNTGRGEIYHAFVVERDGVGVQRARFSTNAPS